jgi:hypothetical protein
VALSEHESNQLAQTLQGVTNLTTAVATLTEKLANSIRLQEEVRGDLYGADGEPGIKGRVQEIEGNCKQRCPSGVWAFFRPIVQNWILWAIIGATAALVYVCVIHSVVTAVAGK